MIKTFSNTNHWCRLRILCCVNIAVWPSKNDSDIKEMLQNWFIMFLSNVHKKQNSVSTLTTIKKLHISKYSTLTSEKYLIELPYTGEHVVILKLLFDRLTLRSPSQNKIFFKILLLNQF